MARIKIGDITIDGDQITIGGEPTYPYSQTTVQTQVVNPWVTQSTAVTKVHSIDGQYPAQKNQSLPPMQTALIRPNPTGLQKRVNDPLMWMLGGTAVGVTASLFYLLTYAPMFATASLVGFIFFVMGLVRYFQGRSNAKFLEEQREQEYRANAKVLKNLLKESKPEQTVEWIVAKTGLSEVSVVKTLSWLSKRGILQEEVDLQTGDWYYYIPSHERLAVEDDLASRMKRLEQGNSRGVGE